MNDRHELNGTSLEVLVGQVADEFTQRLNRGEHPDIEEYAARHPEAASVLRQLLPALEAMGDTPQESSAEPEAADAVSQDASELPTSGILGDFRIVREVGRGGMGVVYEAEQISLGRRVALKVLPFAATMDPRHLQRFHNEARAAAGLHHEHIVPVHAVGCERGVHFYAMQFIEGRTLAQHIEELRGEPTDEATTAYSPVPAADTAQVRATATERPTPDGPYFRCVAQWGIEAAEALEYAHSVGVVHRDVKPANLMIDGAGKLWVTDFGLARTAADSGLTITGDLLGTLRYMSSEQALAKHGLVDHRTDVYSLGVTLYELLTLHPAVEGKDRQEILHNIAFEEPVAPRSRNRAIPVELETIVLKAMAKEPTERYATAKEVADDLRCFLDDRPIRARRPPLRTRLARWGRRHKPLVAGVAAALLMGLAVLAGSIGWVARDREEQRRKSEAVIAAAMKDSADRQAERRLPEALSAARRADGLLAGAHVDEAVRQQVRARLADLELLEKLENIRLEKRTLVKDGHFDLTGPDALYGETFREAGLDVEALPAEEVGERIRGSTVAAELALVLDDWAGIRLNIGGAEDSRGKTLLLIAQLADTDAWRTRVRKALLEKDREAIREVAASKEVFDLSAATLFKVGLALWDDEEARGQAETFLRAAQRRCPNDFWLNENLFYLFSDPQAPRWEEAFHFAAVAVALRPGSPGAHVNLGAALEHKGQLDEALAEYREAIRIKKDYAEAHLNVGHVLQNKGQLDGAIAEFREAIRFKKEDVRLYLPLSDALWAKGQRDEAVAELREAIRIKKDVAEAHNILGSALDGKGQVEEAIAEYREAIRIKKDFAEAHNNLGNALRDKGQLDEAITEYREAIRFKKDDTAAHNNLGYALWCKGQLDEAITEYREAIRIKKDDAGAHSNLGNALKDKGQLDEALAEYREAIRIKKDLPGAHCGLGNVLMAKVQLDEAIAEYREAIRIKKDFAEAHNNLGIALRDKGQLDEALAEYREAIRIKKDYAGGHRNLGDALRDKGQLDEAITEYREAIRFKKDLPEAHCGLGNVLADKGQLDEALAEYREAIRIKKDCVEAHNNLGSALYHKGKLDEALAEYREAIRIKKDYAGAHYNLGNALRNKGQLDEAITEYREAIRFKKDLPEAHCGLGNVLADKGQLDEALAEYREAIRIKKDLPEAHCGLGNVLMAKVQLDEAIAEYREAIRIKKDYADAHANLGIALVNQGQFRQGTEVLRRAQKLYSRNTSKHQSVTTYLQEFERLAELDERLPRFLKGEEQPADAAERLSLAKIRILKKHYTASVRFYRSAFAEQPKLADDLTSPHRYNAACAAAIAGCGQSKGGETLDTKERARLRQQALDWLQDDLKAYRQVMDKSAGKASPVIAQRMQNWLKDSDFSSVRGSESLAQLPEAERKEWQKLWDEVEKLRQRAAEKMKPPAAVVPAQGKEGSSPKE